jgi:hypothetical protein
MLAGRSGQFEHDDVRTRFMRFSDDPKLLRQAPTAAPFLAIDDLDCAVLHRFRPDLTERFKVNGFDI